MRKLSSIVVALCMVLLLAGASWAQTVNMGSVEGTITDPSGAVIPGASITATNTATGVSQSTQSNAEGYYRFIALPVGSYDLTLNKSGFAAQARKGIDVTVGAKISLDIKMGVSGTEQTVNVTEETPLVETTRTNVSTTVGSTAVAQLPVLGRNFLDFVLLTPGVARDVRTGDLSFAGQRGTLNSLTVDGADDNNTFFGQTSGRTGSGRAPYQFSQDAVQEFQVNANGYSAELGHAGGAIINVITKSGTNAFHGAAFEFYRDRGIAANDPIVKLNHAFNPNASLRKPPLHYNQFGGNIGGPIVKSKAFFFFDYDGQRNTTANIVTLTIPTIASPTAFQTAAINYLTARAGSYSRGLNQDTYLLKGDWNIASNQQLSVRWNRQNFTGLNFENGGATNASEHTGSSLVKSDTVAGQLTSTLTPSIVNLVRLNWQRDNEPGQANSNLPEATVRQNSQVLMVVGRNSFSPRFTNINRMESGDTLTWVHRTHTFKTGYDYIHDNIGNFFPGNFSGIYSFNSLENFGRSLAGQPLLTTAPGAAGDSFLQAFQGPGTAGPTTHPNITEFSWFLQDDWRARNNLTLNLGVRYDIQDTAKPSVRNPIAAAAGIFTDQLNLDKNNLAPRIGFAWQPWQTGRTVVRGGYGMFYGRTPSIFIGTAHNQNGVSVIQKTFFTTDIPSYPSTKCGGPVDNPTCPPPSAGTFAPPTIFAMQPKFVEPVVQQANINIEHQLSNDFSVTVGYQYVKGNHLQRTRDINLGTPVATAYTISTGGGGTFLRYAGPTANPTRPIAGLARIFQFESSANSLYHGGFIQLKKRMSRNFQGQVAYTYSHVIDDRPDATAVVPGTDDAKMLFNPQCAVCDRANGDNDQRHRIVVSGIWQLNYANGLNKAGKAILGGWEISTIFSAQSGQPYTGFVGNDLNNDGNTRTDRIPTQGRNSFNLPATWSLDPRFAKSVDFNERAKLQLFVEAFNLFNHFNVYGVRTTQYAVNLATNVLTPQTQSASGVAAFGLPVAAPSGTVPNLNMNGARVFQLGVKVSF